MKLCVRIASKLHNFYEQDCNVLAVKLLLLSTVVLNSKEKYGFCKKCTWKNNVEIVVSAKTGHTLIGTTLANILLKKSKYTIKVEL